MSTPYSRRADAVAAILSGLVSVRDRPVDQQPRYGVSTESAAAAQVRCGES